jgi:mono/diheme cytochrome c family protein
MISRKWMLMIITLLLSGLLFAACTPNQQPLGLTPIPSLAPRATETLAPPLAAQSGISPIAMGARTGNAAIGASIYMAYCGGCHGDQGQGVTGPELQGDQFIKASDDQSLFTKIANGVQKENVMPAWLTTKGGPLTPDDINNVVAFLRTIQDETPLPTSTPLPPPPTEAPAPTVEGATPEPEEPAAPSFPGGPGAALGLVGDINNGRLEYGKYCSNCHGPQGIVPIPNPGTDDQFVPPLNPIDSTLMDPDPKVSAERIDLFIEHGSEPPGPAPQIDMPKFGDKQMLTPQQIADIIAYVISLNPIK